MRTIVLLLTTLIVFVSKAQPNLPQKGTQQSIPAELLSLGDDDDVMRFGSVDTSPMFPGGPDAWNEWLSKTVEYPREARRLKIGGRVVVTFIVERDGSITDIWIRESVDPLLDREAIRVAKKMPKWNPGIFNGKPVRVRYNLPLTFELEGIPITIKKSVLVTPEDHNDTNLRVMRQKREVAGFDNSSFNVSFFSGCDVYNGRGVEVLTGKDSVISVLNSPALNTIFTHYKTNKGLLYGVIKDMGTLGKIRKTIKFKKANLTTACYQANARQLAVARDDKTIIVMNAVNDTTIATLSSSIIPQHMAFSDNGKFLVSTEGRHIEIWNMERHAVRERLVENATVNDVVFADKSRKLLVATSDGTLTVYETSGFKETVKVKGLGTAQCCRPIGEGKYAAVLTCDKTVCIVNLLDVNELTFLNIGHGNTTNIGIATDVNGSPWLIYNSNIELVYSAIGYTRIMGLKPYFNRMMENELTSELNQWMRRMPNETLEEYQLRVKEDSRSAKAHELSLQIATRMAEGVLEEPVMNLGDYNIHTGQLVVHVGKMPDIYIHVPSDEIVSLADKGTNVQLRNVRYLLTENDLFEVAYAEVYNPVTNKVYVFDRMQMDPSAFRQVDSHLVPLDIIMKTNMEEVSLMNIKDEVMSLAKQEKVISDKTQISVVSQVTPDVSADGKNILNYDISFTYEVEQEFSSRDDFKPGRFHTEESGAAMSMLKIMKKAFRTDFAKYVQAGKRVKFSITGTADAIPIVRTLAYDGTYGEYQGEPVYKGNELTAIDLTKGNSISDNYQLAFARAIGVQQYLEKELQDFANMKRDYDYHIDVSKNEGSQYRRISVQCSFIDAF